jgi:hypothetical protein
MGDHSTQALQQLVQQLRDSLTDGEVGEVTLDGLLEGEYLFLNEEAMALILDHIDCFVSQSRGNRSVERMFLYPYALYGHDDDAVWDKVGQALGNLQALEGLRISNKKFDGNNEYDVVPVPNWERVARILSHMRQNFGVNPDEDYNDDGDDWTVGEAQGLARAIRGHPTIIRFDCDRSKTG